MWLVLKASISSLITSYSTSGYLDELRSKWYSSLPCFGNDAYRPQPLGVASVAGVFILLFIGILAGCLTLTLEHLVYKYALPKLRHQPKDTIWRSPNMMFFSQVRPEKSFEFETLECIQNWKRCTFLAYQIHWFRCPLHLTWFITFSLRTVHKFKIWFNHSRWSQLQSLERAQVSTRFQVSNSNSFLNHQNSSKIAAETSDLPERKLALSINHIWNRG